jgi:hypothetical protein
MPRCCDCFHAKVKRGRDGAPRWRCEFQAKKWRKPLGGKVYRDHPDCPNGQMAQGLRDNRECADFESMD